MKTNVRSKIVKEFDAYGCRTVCPVIVSLMRWSKPVDGRQWLNTRRILAVTDAKKVAGAVVLQAEPITDKVKSIDARTFLSLIDREGSTPITMHYKGKPYSVVDVRGAGVPIDAIYLDAVAGSVKP